MGPKITGRLVASVLLATLTVWLAGMTGRCVPFSSCEALPPASVSTTP